MSGVDKFTLVSGFLLCSLLNYVTNNELVAILGTKYFHYVGCSTSELINGLAGRESPFLST